MTLLPVAGLVGSNNLSTAVIILGIGVLLIFVANPRYLQFLALGGAGIGFIAVFLAAESYRLERLAIWRDPEKYEKGFQTIQGLYAIGSGGIFGKGFGNSLQKLGFVPEAQNDMIFSIVCEETGILGAFLTLFLFGILIWRLCILALNCRDLQGTLLCAGITTYSPLRHWHVGPGKKVGVVGIGGLGHMGIKLAHAMGAHVVAFTTSESKRNAARALGADDVVVSRNEDEMAAHVKSFDFILNTVAAPHNLDAFTTLLKRDGTMTLVGAPATPHPSPEVFNLIFRRRSIAGSMIGGIPETQEMLDFCAEHGIVADIELIRGDEINEAWERMVKGDVKYRFVIDSATLAG